MRKLELVGIAEIAKLANVTRQVVANWRSRRSDFPEPLAELASGPVFDAVEIRKFVMKMNSDTSNQCPICLNPAERGRDRDYGERKQVRCERCGEFQITQTALAMLASRFDKEGKVRARFSHAVCQAANLEPWFLIDSKNVDKFVQSPLPDPERQTDYLLTWIQQQVGDDFLGDAIIDSYESISGYVGAIDGERVERLIQLCVNEGLVNFDDESLRISLAPAGVKRLSRR